MIDMTVSRKITPLAGLLILTCVALLAIIWLETANIDQKHFLHTKESYAVNDNAIKTVEQENFDIPPIEDYEEFINRPLFSESRKPEEAESESEQEQFFEEGSDVSDYIADYHLMGILIKNSTRVAYLIDLRTHELQRLTSGDRIGEWSVKEINPDTVIFNGSNGETTELVLWQQSFSMYEGSGHESKIKDGKYDKHNDGQKDMEETKVLEEEVDELVNQGAATVSDGLTE